MIGWQACVKCIGFDNRHIRKLCFSDKGSSGIQLNGVPVGLQADTYTGAITVVAYAQ